MSILHSLMHKAAKAASDVNADNDIIFARVKSLMLVAAKRHENSANALDALGSVVSTYADAIRATGAGYDG